LRAPEPTTLPHSNNGYVISPRNKKNLNHKVEVLTRKEQTEDKPVMNPSQKAQDALDELGVSVYDSGGAMRDMFDIMQDLEIALSELADKQRAAAEGAIFNSNALKGWNTITVNGVESIRELSEELSDSVNAFDGMEQTAGMAAIQKNPLPPHSKAFILFWRNLEKSYLKFETVP